MCADLLGWLHSKWNGWAVAKGPETRVWIYESNNIDDTCSHAIRARYPLSMKNNNSQFSSTATPVSTLPTNEISSCPFGRPGDPNSQNKRPFLDPL